MLLRRHFPTLRFIVFPLPLCPNVQLGAEIKPLTHAFHYVRVQKRVMTDSTQPSNHTLLSLYLWRFHCVHLQVSHIKHEDFKLNTEEMSKMVTDVQLMKGKQESMDSKISTLKQ